MSAIAWLLATPALAGDDSPGADVQRVEIVGVRASLAASQQSKRERRDIVDSVVAEDIDRLRDTSVTEALQRITGVQVGRDRGEASGVAVRGLVQVETTLDGREVFTAGAGRVLDLTDEAAELVAAIDVHKTASASRVEGGVGGQIDLRTRRPFDFDGAVVAGTLRGAYEDLADAGGAQYAGLASRRWRLADGAEIGALVAVSHQRRPWREDQKSVGNPVVRADLVPGRSVVAPNGTSETTSAGKRIRDGASAVVQVRPWPGLELMAEGHAMRLRTTQDSWQVNVGASPTFVPGSVSLFPGTDDVARVTWTNAPISVLSFARDTIDRTGLAAVGGRWTQDATTIGVDVSRTTSHDGLFFSGPFFAGTAAEFAQDLSTSIPSSAVTGTDLLAPSTFHYTGVAYRVRPFDGTLTAGRLDVERRIDGAALHAVSAGVRLARRQAGNGSGLVFGDVPVTGLGVVDLPGEAVPDPHGDFLPGSGATSVGPHLVGSLAEARDPLAMRAAFGIATPLPTAGNPLSVWRIAETTQDGYVTADLGPDGATFSGNAGLRAVRTRTAVNGYESVPGTSNVQPLALEATTMDWLPSVNLRQALGGGRYLRIAASRTLTRPNFDQLSPSLSLVPNSIDPSLNSGSAGNPALRPIRADGLDLAFEAYFDRSGSASITAFVKRVDGFITVVSQPEVHDGATYQVSRPQNTDIAHIKGVEAAYQQFYSSLPGPWGGLGLQANATWVDSHTPSSLLGADVPLANLSRFSANVVGLYEHGPVSASVAWNWRDRFLSGISNFVGVGAQPVYVRAYSWLDASFVYRLDARVSFALTGGNLLGTMRHSYFGDGTTRPQSVWQNDRVYTASVSLRI